MGLTAEGIFEGTRGIYTCISWWFILAFQACFEIPGLVWVCLPTALPDPVMDNLLMGVWWRPGNFKSYKCQLPSYTDGMEEPMLNRKELIENHPGEGSVLSFMRWGGAWSLEARLGGITKVQADFLKLCFSDHDLTLRLKQRGVGLEYPLKQQPERGEAFIGRTLWKNTWALKYQSAASRQVIVLCGPSETMF